MTSADREPRGLGVSQDKIRHWQDLGLIVSRLRLVKAERSSALVQRASGTSQFGAFPRLVEHSLPALTVEPAERTAAE